MSKVRFAGIDVGSAELVAMCLGDSRAASYANDRAGHRALIRSLARPGQTVRVCLEATGVYSWDLANALSRAQGIEVMVANPRAIKDFAGAMMARSKTDALDAEVLAQFAARMPFVNYEPPSPSALGLRSISRRIAQLKQEAAAEKNRLHADSSSSLGAVGSDIKAHIRFLEQRIKKLVVQAQKLIAADAALKDRYSFLISVKGIASLSAIRILAELAVLPGQLSKRQWTAYAGLDPRRFDSGSSVHRAQRISKAGNAHLRRALYMPALVAVRYEPRIKAYYEHLLVAGKKPLQAIVAVMRKLICAIWGMFSRQEAFNGEMFYQVPVSV